MPDSDPLIAPNLALAKKPSNTFWSSRYSFFCKSHGKLTAHYGVEGCGFFGIPLAAYLPYLVTDLATQLGFSDCDGGLAAGLFIAHSSCATSEFQKSGGFASRVVIVGLVRGWAMDVMMPMMLAVCVLVRTPGLRTLTSAESGSGAFVGCSCCFF